MKIIIKKISYHLPGKPRNIDELQTDNPEWEVDKIVKKTGIHNRYIADKNETALDLAYNAGLKMLSEKKIRDKIDLLIFVTQSPDYILPTSACILQNKLELPKHCMAFDVNLGCSGFIYALSIAGSLIESGVATNGLIICADTYSKYIKNNDRTNRPIFSDGAAATLLQKSKSDNIGPFILGTDGAGFESLIVKEGGARNIQSSISKTDRVLEMRGSEVFLFTMRTIPKCVNELLEKANIGIEKVDLFIFHQASKIVIDNLVNSLSIDDKKVFINYHNIGNTVSATIPIALEDAKNQGKLKSGDKLMLIGFGVGLSWGATLINWIDE